MNQGTMIVTGGGRGVGAAVCRLGAAAGYDICVNYLSNSTRAEEVVGEIEEAGGRAKAFGSTRWRRVSSIRKCTNLTACLTAWRAMQTAFRWGEPQHPRRLQRPLSGCSRTMLLIRLQQSSGWRGEDDYQG